MNDSKGLRRVVTRIDENGAAVVLFDGENPHAVVRPVRNNVSRVVWATDGSPATMSGDQDRAVLAKGTSPPPEGTVFRIVDFPPISPDVDSLAAETRLSELVDEPPIKGRAPRHPLMHRTRTVDYAVIMSGEVDMLLDDSEVHLRAGDVVVQQGTNHAWINRGRETCRIAFILVDAKDPYS